MAWFQEIHRICKRLKADYDPVVEFVSSTQKEGKQASPVFDPGLISGHCIIPRTEKLRATFPSKLVDALLEWNRRKAEEMKTSKQRAACE